MRARFAPFAPLLAALAAATPTAAQEAPAVQRTTYTPSGALTGFVRVEADGEASVTVVTYLATSTRRGRATPDELRRLRAAVAAADVGSLPDELPRWGRSGAAAGAFKYSIRDPACGLRTVEGTAGRIGPPYRERLAPLELILHEIATRLQDADRSRAFQSLVRRIEPSEGDVSAREVTVLPGGQVEVRETFRSGAPPRVSRGDVAPGVIEDIAASLRRARFAELPARLPRADAPPPGGALVQYRVVTPDGSHEVRGSLPFLTDERGRPLPGLDGLGQILDEISSWITRARPSLDDFDWVRLEASEELGDARYLQRSVRVAATGEVEIARRHGPRSLPTIRALATADELDRLRLAVREGRVGTVPTSLDVPLPSSVASAPFRLSVTHRGEAWETRGGRIGAYGRWEVQVAPIVEALAAIERRLVPAPFQGEVRGRVAVQSGRVFLRDAEGRLFQVVDDGSASFLRGFHGFEATVSGRGAPGGEGWTLLEVARILDPVRVDGLEAVAGARSGEPVLVLRGAEPAEPAELAVHGPVAELLAPADESARRLVAVDGYLFHVDGRPRAAYVTAVAGEATGLATLSRNGRWTGFVRGGSDLKIGGLIRDGEYALVESSTGLGYLRTDRLEVGRPFEDDPSPTPSAPAAASAQRGAGSVPAGVGLSDRVEGTTTRE